MDVRRPPNGALGVVAHRHARGPQLRRWPLPAAARHRPAAGRQGLQGDVRGPRRLARRGHRLSGDERRGRHRAWCSSAAATCSSRRRRRPSAGSCASSPDARRSTPRSRPRYIRLNPSDYRQQVRAAAAAGRRRSTQRVTRRAAERVRARVAASRSSVDLRDLSPDDWYLLPPAKDFVAEVDTRRLRHAHLLALVGAGRGRQPVPARQQEDDRPLRVGRQAGGARAVLQRRRVPRLRRAGLQRRRVDPAGAAVHPGPRAPGDARAQHVDGVGDAAPRRGAAGAERGQRRVRAAAAPARARPEHRCWSRCRASCRRTRTSRSSSPTTDGWPSQDLDVDTIAVEGEAGRRTRRRSSRSSRTTCSATAPTGIRRTRCGTSPRRPSASPCPTATARWPAASCCRPSQVIALRDGLTQQQRRRRSCSASNQPLRYLALVVSRMSRVVGEGDDHRGVAARRRHRQGDGGRGGAAAAARARAPARDPGRRHHAVLRDARGRGAVHVDDDCAGRKRPARRPQPGLLRGGQRSGAERRQRPGAATRRRSTASPSSSSRTSSHTSGGARRSAGRTTTSSGSARGSRSTSPRSTAGRSRGDRVFSDMLRQFRRWSLAQSDQGPIHLGYRLGHIKSDLRVYRAHRLQQGRGGAAHAAPPARRRGVLRRAPPLLRRPPLPEGGHRRSASARSRPNRAARSTASSSAGFTATTSRASASSRRSATAR